MTDLDRVRRSPKLQARLNEHWGRELKRLEERVRATGNAYDVVTREFQSPPDIGKQDGNFEFPDPGMAVLAHTKVGWWIVRYAAGHARLPRDPGPLTPY